MTEFWVSNAKHYCKYCKVWMQGDRVSIRNHESGKRHQEALLEFKKERSEAKRGAALDERELQKQLREIEKAAAAAVDQDLASGAVRFSEKVSGASRATPVSHTITVPSRLPVRGVTSYFTAPASSTAARTSA